MKKRDYLRGALFWIGAFALWLMLASLHNFFIMNQFSGFIRENCYGLDISFVYFLGLQTGTTLGLLILVALAYLLGRSTKWEW